MKFIELTMRSDPTGRLLLNTNNIASIYLKIKALRGAGMADVTVIQETTSEDNCWEVTETIDEVIALLRKQDVQVEDQASLKAEIARLKKDKLEFNAQCFHKDETISVLEKRITELELENRSLVERMNRMALKPNQAVIEYFYPKYNPITKRLENLPTKECLCIVELYSGEYEIVWWISAGFEETGWDGYCVDEVKSWAYLPKGVTNE
jgi:hypothetical protein